MFINLEFLGYDINSPQSIPQSIKDMYFLNLIEEIQSNNITTPDIINKLKILSNVENEKDIFIYYEKLMSNIISIYKENINDSIKDNENKEIDCFTLLSLFSYNMWKLPLIAILKIKKEKDNIKKNNETRLYFIIEQACSITIPVGEDQQADKIKNRDKFLKEMFGLNDNVEENITLLDNVKKFPNKLPGLGKRKNKNNDNEVK